MEIKKQTKGISLETIRTIILIISFSLLSYGAGYWYGTHSVEVFWKNYTPRSLVVNSKVPERKNVDFSLFWKVWDELEKKYLEKDSIDPQKMVFGAIKGMTASLGDPYTVFLPPVQNDKTRENLQGEFDGIGAKLGMKNDRIVIVAPLKGMPAEKAGVKEGDYILKVDGKDTSGWTVPEAVDVIRGKKGTPVVLTLLREEVENPFDIEIIRDVIEVPTVETEFKEIASTSDGKNETVFHNEAAVIHLYQFGEQTNKQWNEFVDKVIKHCNDRNNICKGIVLDVRNNPGGYLNGAVFIASEFLDGGVVVKQQTAGGYEKSFSVERKGKLLTQPLVVLINKGSASASEIVAGALKVRGRATIVGEQSFGKGTIQERIELPYDAGLHVTTAKWLLPDGSWVHNKGVTPDVVVKDNPDTPDKDEQLEKAIEVLHNMNQ